MLGPTRTDTACQKKRDRSAEDEQTLRERHDVAIELEIKLEIKIKSTF